MANLQQAPILQFDIEKPEGSNNFYKLPQQLMDAVFAGLGNSSAQLRIMIVLIGTKPGFGVSEEWILQRTSLLHSSYITARKALVDKGWITLEKGIIRVNFKTILNSSNMVLPQNDNNETSKEKSNMVLPQKSNMVLQQRGNMVLPIINKEQINKIDKKVNYKNEAYHSLTNPDGSFKM